MNLRHHITNRLGDLLLNAIGALVVGCLGLFAVWAIPQFLVAVARAYVGMDQLRQTICFWLLLLVIWGGTRTIPIKKGPNNP